MNGDKKPFNWFHFWLGFALVSVLFVLCLGLVASVRGSAEGFSLASVEDTTSAAAASDPSSNEETTSPDVVIVQNATADPEFQINNDTQLYSPEVQRATYTAVYDITTSDSYASMLYDVFLNQGSVFDDFIIYRSGDYQYVLIYGKIKDDLTFSDCNIVTLNYSSYSQSGKRYNFTYTSGSGSFNSNNYNFVSNIEVDNALLFHNYFMRRELYACRVALYIISVLNIFNLFKFFRGGLKTI